MKNLRDVFEQAGSERAAVGHFNVSDFTVLKAVFAAAEGPNVPAGMDDRGGQKAGSVEQDLDEAVEFGPFRLVPARRLLTDQGVPVPLGGRALEILVILVEHAPEMVSKKTLFERVWPGIFVAESNLRFQMRTLRKALGEGDRYISTVSGRGYCFVAPLVRSRVAPKPVAAADTNPPQPLINIVARERELAESQESLGHERLVTRVGPGGVCKARLAIKLGCRVLGACPDEVWLIDLVLFSESAPTGADSHGAVLRLLPHPEAIAPLPDLRPRGSAPGSCRHWRAAWRPDGRAPRLSSAPSLRRRRSPRPPG
jgi:DNA-binding winged helix-turn-helix (wHTH) protein